MTQPRRVEPRILKGFRDIKPDLMRRREAMLDTFRATCRRYGFVPIDTPILEYAEVLLAKAGGETEKQVYRFLDQGGRDVAMRFDLTVPLARFVAVHGQALGMPLKRYHAGPVWRGEKPAPGRFREFWQGDFDTIGTTSPMADLETLLVIVRLLRTLEIGAFEIALSDRGLLAGLCERLGKESAFGPILRALDKLPKVGVGRVEDELRSLGLAAGELRGLLDFATRKGPNDAILEAARAALGENGTGLEACERLATLLAGLERVGVTEVRLDLSIARGLDYYTGPVFETFLVDRRDFGSICSGGRYDDLVGHYTKEKLPGIGASVGLDRLLEALPAGEAPVRGAVVLVVQMPGARPFGALEVAETLRQAAVPAELYPEPRKLQKQLQYANRRGSSLAVMVGPDEEARGEWLIKDLRSGQQHAVESSQGLTTVQTLLGTTVSN